MIRRNSVLIIIRLIVLCDVCLGADENYTKPEVEPTTTTSLTSTTVVTPTQEPTEIVGKEPRIVGYFLGDTCEHHCNENITHAHCNRTTKLCQCDKSHPIMLDILACIAPQRLGEVCNYEQACLFYDPHSMCRQTSPFYSKCACKDDYHQYENRNGVQKCVPDPSTLLDSDVPTIFGVGIGLTLFSGLTCLVLKLFSRARFGQNGGHYANANIAPPIMMTGTSTPSSQPPSRRSSGRSMLAPPSRAGSRRPSVSSVRSQSSIRSYRHDRGHHESLRATMSAPINDANSPCRNVRILEQKFAQHSGASLRREESRERYDPRYDPRYERESSRHSSQEIITDVINESPEKLA